MAESRKKRNRSKMKEEMSKVGDSILNELHELKTTLEYLKSEEDLVSVALLFLNRFVKNSPLISIVTTDNIGSCILYGKSYFLKVTLDGYKENILNHIDEQSHGELQCKRFKVFVEESKPIVEEFDINKLEVFPMFLGNKLHGVFLIYINPETEIDRKLVRFVQWMFQEKYFLISRKHQELLYKKMQVINEAREMIYSVINLEDMFSILGDIVLKYAKADLGFVVLFNKNDKKLRIKASWHSLGSNPYEYMSEFERDFPDNLSVIRIEGKGNLFDFIRDTARIAKLDSAKIEKQNDDVDIIIPEMLFIPLIVRERVIGCLSVIRKQFVREKFGENDISILETIVSLAAASVENNRLYDQSLREQITKKELQTAHNIQVGLQAKHTPNLKNFDIAAMSLPARVIGGDYYDFFPLGDNIVGVSLTDIVGKGIPAALIMAFFKGIMQSSVFDEDEPNEVFEKVNENLYKNKSVKSYIPSVYMLLDDEKNVMTYSNAGHENPFLYNYKEDSFRLLDEGGLPLGAFSGNIYDQEDIIMEKGDIAVLFTDGVTEARNRLGISYGEKRLQELIRKKRDASALDIMNQISQDVLLHSKDVPLHDDYTIVVVKRT